jgi:hypothetical protein
MKAFVTWVVAAAALSSIACSAPSEGESVGTTDQALAPCTAELASPCPVPPPSFNVVGSWRRHTATVTEDLDLRADGTYSLTELVGPVCVRAPCPAFPTTYLHTEGAYAVGGRIIKLRPVTPDPRLPELFDIVRPLPRIEPTPVTEETAGDEAAPEETSRPALGFLLHAVEMGRDVYLAREIECPAGTTMCMQCGARPPGGVCTSFVCLPPTRPCLPVP